MHFFKSTFGGILLVIILALAILAIREPRLLSAPNDWLINDTYDGFRSYAAMEYHIRHDSTYWHFEGMHYPYGDKVAFTDNLPLLSNLIKFYADNIADISGYSAGFLNGFMLLSLVLCAVFLFLSFKALRLPAWYNIPVSLGIAFLSPQIFRMEAHYGLAHPFVIPMLFYLSLLFHKKKKWSYSFLIAGLLFLCAQIHFYLFAIGASLIAALLFVKTIFGYSRQALVVNGVHLFIQVLLPFLILQWMLADTLPDRPSRPYGFMAYKACWESVFLPVDFWLGDWISDYITEIRKFNREGIAYLGLIGVLFFIKEILLHTWHKTRRLPYATLPENKDQFFLKSAFWAGLLILLFSFGIPFVIPGLEEWPYALGPLGQLRSIGRFAWVTFYVFNIWAFYALFHQLQKVSLQKVRRLLYGLVLGVLLIESGVFIFDVVKLPLWPSPENRPGFQKSEQDWLDTLNTSEYQAILTVPYFHIGSENIWVPPSKKAMHHSVWLSVQTGLPINSSFMGRTSVGQVIRQMQLIAEPYRIPAILEDLPNQKDFLVFVHKEAHKIQSYRYHYLLEELTVLYEDEEMLLCRLPISIIKNRIQEQADHASAFLNQNKWHPVGNLLSSDSLQRFIALDFDQRLSEKKYLGKGAYQIRGFPGGVLLDKHIPFQDNGSTYIFSLWSFIGGDLYPKTNLSIEEYQAGSGHVLARTNYVLNKYCRAIDQDWMLSEFPFKIQRPDSRIRIKIWNSDLAGEHIYVDELQVRLKKTSLMRRVDAGIIVNNRFYPSKN